MLGALERFLGILIEHYAGQFPTWLAPVQAVVMNITENQADAAAEIAAKLKQQGYRVIKDLRNEKVGFKIREHTIQRVPYLVVIGDREKATGELAVRTQSGEDLGVMTLAAFVEHLNK
jgi:threonyl-tRNA synthetase